MVYNGDDDDTAPKVSEGIIECRWVHLRDLHDYVNYGVLSWTMSLTFDIKILLTQQNKLVIFGLEGMQVFIIN